jgi:hypothetical protein
MPEHPRRLRFATNPHDHDMVAVYTTDGRVAATGHLEVDWVPWRVGERLPLVLVVERVGEGGEG